MIRFARHRIAHLLAVVIGIYSIIVMAGWVFDIDAFTRIVSAHVSINMKFVTAFLFLLSASGLFLISRVVQDEDEVAGVFLPGIALTLAIVASSMLAGRLLGIPTGIETLFVRQPDILTITNLEPVSGLPSIPALLNFMIFSVVTVIANFATVFRKQYITIMSFAIIAIACVAMIGYAFNVPALYFEFNNASVPMAFNTALCFILLGIGLAFVNRAEKNP
ncbi:MAG: hypothetical protein PHV99_00965 [Candidatus Pacebacteria bacterium]|nr:hypothetical protein [Candidatus Paceibacterota bacterium]